MNRITLCALLLAAGGAAVADNCKYRRSLDFDADATGLRTLNIAAGAGQLKVSGAADQDQVVVKATACASSERLLEGLQVDHHRDGVTLELRTRFPDEGWSWMGKQYAYIHLEISVPETLELDIEDGSGPAEIERVAAVRIEDGSGELSLRDIGGDVHIDDGSGAIHVRSVAGSARVTDGSGGIDIAGVEGTVTIEEDGSGEIEIRDVIGDVEIDEDGSGEIRIAQVGGSVLVRRDGSGGIEVNGVGGDFKVDRDGGGALSYRDVNGRVSVPPGKERRK